MKQLGCIRAGMLLDRRAAGLSAAEALRLEEHLASCERCSEDARLLDGLRALSDTQRHDARGACTHACDRSRVCTGARTAPARASVRSRRPQCDSARRSRWLRRLRSRCAAGLNQPATPAPRPAPPWRRGADGARGPCARRHGRGRRPAASCRRTTRLARRVARQRGCAPGTGTGQFELRAGSDVRWNAGARVLRVEAGSVLADVDPSAHQSFVVETARFRVLVLGTRFEVTQDGVRVERGRVRVVAPDGSVLAERVDAGQQYVVAGEAATARPEAAPRAARARAQCKAGARAGRCRSLARTCARSARRETRERCAGGDRQRARTASGDTRARRSADAARGVCVGRGRPGRRGRAYQRVAHSFAASPAGENALFAAARIEAERGHSAAAVQLLERDLEQYPHGRFEQEARARLQKLSAVLDRAP